VTYAAAVLSTAAIVSALGEFLGPGLGFSSPGQQRGFAILAALSFAAIAWLGLRLSAWVWSGLTLLKLVPLLLLAAFTLPLLPTLAAAPAVATNLEPGGLLRAALIAVFPLQGFEIVAVPSGEVSGSRRSVLAATLGSLAFAALLYVVLQLGCVLSLPRLASSSAPIVEAGTALVGSASAGWFAAGTNISAVGIAFGMFAMTPRYLAALGTPALLGAALRREHRGVPTTALAITLLAVIVLISSSSLGRLFVLSALAVLAQFAVTAAALFRLALRRAQGLGVVDLAAAPLTLLAIVALGSAAKQVEIAILAAILLTGFGLLALRRRLALGRPAR
jgi:amino acid transporter